MLRSTIQRNSGNTIFLSLIIVTLLVGLSAAQTALVTTDHRQANFYYSRVMLRSCGESSIAIALQDLRNGNTGHIGCDKWDLATNDVGEDGIAGTKDSGEADGLPTLGEPNISLVTVGASELGASMFVRVLDSGIVDVSRIVVTVYSGDESVTVERQVKISTASVPKVGAVYVQPNATMYFNGNTFQIDGRDHDADDGSLVNSTTDEWGVATADAATAGDNATAIIAQIPSGREDQIRGKIAAPAVGETSPVDVDALVQCLQGSGGSHYRGSRPC